MTISESKFNKLRKGNPVYVDQNNEQYTVVGLFKPQEFYALTDQDKGRLLDYSHKVEFIYLSIWTDDMKNVEGQLHGCIDSFNAFVVIDRHN